MHSWVFRNRGQLRLIYGSTPLEPECDEPARETRRPLDAGGVERQGNDVILTPMLAAGR
jgi:hypothetical protein